MTNEIQDWIEVKLAEKGHISRFDKDELILTANIGSTKFPKWMRRYGLFFNREKQIWVKNLDLGGNNLFIPPDSPNSHIELLDYDSIWQTIQQTPSISAAATIIHLPYQKVARINRMLDEYFVEGVLDEWLRVTGKLLSIQILRGSDHNTDRLMMELRQVFVGYFRDPIDNSAPSNDDIDWVYEQIQKEFDEHTNLSEFEDSKSKIISRIISSAGNKNFHQNQGSWSKFEKELGVLTSCGWKMGMAKSNSGKDNAINRLYTTGVIRSYPEVLVQCLFMNDFFDEIIHVYVNEFAKKMRCSPILILVEKISEEEWNIHKILVQDKHPHCPFTELEVKHFFGNCDIMLVDSEPFELSKGWSFKDTIQQISDADAYGEVPNLGETMSRIMHFQKSYSQANTIEMNTRGLLVRGDMPRILEDILSIEDNMACKGSDGLGRKSKIPWIRIYNHEYSPKPTIGWYLVYLFSLDGNRVYLSLNSGTTKYEGGSLVHRSEQEINSSRQIARRILGFIESDESSHIQMDLSDSSKLARGYVRADIFSLKYDLNEMPSEEILFSDFKEMVKKLNLIYTHSGYGSKASPEAPPIATQKIDFSNAYTRWTTKEDDNLVNAFLSGTSVKELSIIHKRKRGGITSRLKKLGMIEDD